jgi:hypothetical protein
MKKIKFKYISTRLVSRKSKIALRKVQKEQWKTMVILF